MVDWLAEQFLYTEEVDLRRDRQSLHNAYWKLLRKQKIECNFPRYFRHRYQLTLSLQLLTAPNICRNLPYL